jgi:hypothetical protein
MGFQCDGLIAGVDALHGLLDAAAEIRVAGDARAAGRGDLHHREPLAVPGVIFEELADGFEPLDDSLGVVEPVDAERQVSARTPNSLSSCFRAASALFFHRLAVPTGRGPHRAVERDADRVRPNRAGVPMAEHSHVIAVSARFEHAIHRGEKIMAVKRNVKPDQVGAEQPIKQFGLPGANSECLRIGPGNMPEDRDARIGPLLLDKARQQSQMIVLHKDHRLRAVAHLFEQRVGKPPVHELIALPVAARKMGRVCAMWQSGQSPSLEKPS